MSASLHDTWTRPADGMVMVYVPGGEFEMGSTEGRDNEQPVHTVVLDGFWIDQTEVTNAQFAQCVAAGACASLEAIHSYTRDFYYGDSAYDDYPVVNITWYQAEDYKSWFVPPTAPVGVRHWIWQVMWRSGWRTCMESIPLGGR